jgi:hypothetical protein
MLQYVNAVPEGDPAVRSLFENKGTDCSRRWAELLRETRQ